MWLIFLTYLLMASTFTLAKTAVYYMQPVYFIAFRMILAGMILLGYLYLFNREKKYIFRNDALLFAQIIIFHIYCAYVLEFWAMRYVSSSKACLLYNLSPFITALFCYLLYNQRLSYQKWLAMIIGFCAMFPILMAHNAQEQSLFSIGFLSLAEIALLFAVASAAYGWLVMKQLMDRGYTPVMINGIGMLGGGFLALMTAFYSEGLQPFIWVQTPADRIGKLLVPHLGVTQTAIIMGLACMASLIIIANIIGYNLYGYLLRHYSPTFLSFAGFITPFFASIFGLFFLGEPLSIAFIVSFSLTVLSLYLFYRNEITSY